jgi:hypothetical protein
VNECNVGRLPFEKVHKPHLQLLGVLRDGRHQGVVSGDKAEAASAHFVNSLCSQKVNVSEGLCCACSSAGIALCQVVSGVARELASKL